MLRLRLVEILLSQRTTAGDRSSTMPESEIHRESIDSAEKSG
jgi:hypothetical protein